MNKQISLSVLSDELAQVRTKKKEFLAQMERIIPWSEWLALIKVCYYKGGRGNQPYSSELMLRLHATPFLTFFRAATTASAFDKWVKQINARGSSHDKDNRSREERELLRPRKENR